MPSKLKINAIIIKMQIFHEIKYGFKGNFYVIKRFRDYLTSNPSDLITNLTYVLVDNFCPCLNITFPFKFKKKSE